MITASVISDHSNWKKNIKDPKKAKISLFIIFFESFEIKPIKTKLLHVQINKL